MKREEGLGVRPQECQQEGLGRSRGAHRGDGRPHGEEENQTRGGRGSQGNSQCPESPAGRAFIGLSNGLTLVLGAGGMLICQRMGGEGV